MIMVADRKGQIVAKATALFSARGYDDVSIKELAEACGVSEAALYRHFRSKADVYNAVLDSVMARIDYPGLFTSLEKEDNLENILRRIAEFLINFLTENDDLYRLLLFATLKEHSKAKEIHVRIRGSFIEFLTGQIERFMEKGMIHENKPNVTARCFIGMVMDCALSINLWQGIDRRKIDPRESINNNIPIYVRGLIRGRDKEDS